LLSSFAYEAEFIKVLLSSFAEGLLYKFYNMNVKLF